MESNKREWLGTGEEATAGDIYFTGRIGTEVNDKTGFSSANRLKVGD